MAGGQSTLMSEADRLDEEIKSTKAALKKFKKIAKEHRAKHGGQGEFVFLLQHHLPPSFSKHYWQTT